MNAALIGAGSWGTSLAIVLNSNKHRVRCYTIEQTTIYDVQTKGENSRYLPGVKIPKEIEFTGDLKYAVEDADIIINAVPSQITRSVIPQVINALNSSGQIWVTVSKGI